MNDNYHIITQFSGPLKTITFENESVKWVFYALCPHIVKQ